MVETETFSKSQIATLKHIQKKGFAGYRRVRNWRNSWKQGILRRKPGKVACRVKSDETVESDVKERSGSSVSFDD